MAGVWGTSLSGQDQGVVTSQMPRQTGGRSGSGDPGRVGGGPLERDCDLWSRDRASPGSNSAGRECQDLFSLSSFPPLPARKPGGKSPIDVIHVAWPLGVRIRMGRVDGQMESIWHNPIYQHQYQQVY